MLTLNRPAIIESDELRLSREYSSARWIYHRLLDFEAEHERVLEATAESIAPGIVRVGRLIARLAGRARRRERTTKGNWSPNPHPALAAKLRARLDELKAARNADPRWKEALGWADAPVGGIIKPRRRRAKPAEKIKRRKTESDEAYAKRLELLTHDETDEHYAAKIAKTPRRSRRDEYRNKLYAERHIYWGTWNALLRNVDQARQTVLKRRAQGLPAELRRPKYRDSITLAADAGGFRIVERGCGDRWVRDPTDPDGRRMIRQEGGGPWWIIEMRLGVNSEWVRLRAKCGTWHQLPADAAVKTAQLTRRKDGERWAYSLSLTVEMTKPMLPVTSRLVTFDWGHREHGHPNERQGIRAFTWLGDDGRKGEVLIPAVCRELLDEIDTLKSRVDTAFAARKEARNLPDKNRFTYRRRLMRSGVRTEEEALWLRWEMRYERRIARRRKKHLNLRRECYIQAVRDLRQHYGIFAFENELVDQLKQKQKDDQMERRKRANRDLTARHEFVSLCERFGAKMIGVSARNTTRECPEVGCGGLLHENGPDLIVACPKCGTVRDKDHGAARVIMTRAKEALANRAV